MLHVSIFVQHVAQKIVLFAMPQFLCNIVALRIVVKNRPL